MCIRDRDCGDAWSSLHMSHVRPIATTNCYRAHRVLSDVVAQLQLWIVEKARELVPQPKGVGAGLAEWTRRKRRSACSFDLHLDFSEHRRSPFHAQRMTTRMVHPLITRMGVDGKQLSHLHQDPRRDQVLLIELHCLVELSSRMRPTSGVHHLRSADTVVGRIVVRLQNAFEVAEKT